MREKFAGKNWRCNLPAGPGRVQGNFQRAQDADESREMRATACTVSHGGDGICFYWSVACQPG
ncbi:hypothetical protein THTE_4493 [Thermogutta terrifontis]|uniref:Uncharacterized protein n=1 Tax=Thermogutta terrifontis TaxID=1331910 RepID=A0A286RM95_9BACT|nr:hypothetical protein THTE_4493 [Thermogutta terrifontis]